MLTIYGTRPSRVARCLWTLEELRLPYRQLAVPDKRAPAFLALNPMGKVPVLVDGDFVLTESVAINAYLAALKPGPLLPEAPRLRARIDQWTSWAITEVEFHFTVMVREIRRAGEAGGAPDATLVATCLQGVQETLGALETHLAAGNAYVAGEDFTIGDINAAFPIAGIAPRIDMKAFPAIAGWLARCTARPAWQRVLAIDESRLAA
ncbi:glutathione S-transferase family protein [Sandaracinobacter sp. RS1-74]|uniref:glutathione S-transferase family protein n=1 Tax=Sandaracinobacteroides sayramensis TaxID=2913411 RepID=UPI001EDA3C8C|nr:glutathione S-transferase family protein [Sandaracinobacteroides sayramensis]MCG2840918.1 glutathione S-transferase family protein [Sandaracinobacteroides sayramensis]